MNGTPPKSLAPRQHRLALVLATGALLPAMVVALGIGNDRVSAAIASATAPWIAPVAMPPAAAPVLFASVALHPVFWPDAAHAWEGMHGPSFAAVALPPPAGLRTPNPAPALPQVATGSAASGSDTRQEADMPAILGFADAARYRTIFAIQAEGRWEAADAEIATLDDPLLLGHVLAQRYLSTKPFAYRVTEAELRQWLTDYPDHIDAKRVFALAQKRKTSGSPPLPAPLGDSRAGDDFLPDFGPGAINSGKTAALEMRRQMARPRTKLSFGADILLFEPPMPAAGGGEPIDESALAEPEEDRQAIPIEWPAKPDGPNLGADTHWSTGLAAWKSENYDEARRHFETLAETKGLTGWDRAAAAFWAARANLRVRRPEVHNYWMGRAAEYPRTFYGLLARRVLGFRIAFDWGQQPLSRAEIDLIRSRAGGKRALALLQIGDDARAQAELRRLYSTSQPVLARALVALAERANMPMLALRFAHNLTEPQGRVLEAGLYPIPRWRPAEGFLVDRALVFAVMRQESAFDTNAASAAGAKGLMQIMPQTASHIAGDRGFLGSKRQLLFDPVTNVDLGQKYLRQLLDHDAVRGNLLLAAAAYNGGPSRAAGWAKKIDRDSDPLWFLESLPLWETREFVAQVFANLWIYRARMGQADGSLDALAEGRWPIYSPQDVPEVELADRDGGF